MKYAYQNTIIPQSQRQMLNEKIIYLINSGEALQHGITNEDVYNAYTGDSALHGLNRADYDNYARYSEAKKDIENGQVFTPPALCRFVVQCLNPNKEELIADLTCGMGGFFNFLPSERNLYGCEIDIRAAKVARYLYPDAAITNTDIRLYQPEVRFDCVIGNPPFHLKWWIEDKTELSSHLYYCIKASECLKPLGILAVIQPMSFLADEFSNGSMIDEMQQRFSFLGQVSLPEDAFAAMGIAQFPTKLQFWQKKGDLPGFEAKPYHCHMDYVLTENSYEEGLANQIWETLLKDAQSILRGNRFHILKELAKDAHTSKEFEYEVRKLLYQIRCHPALTSEYARGCEYLHRFYTQKQPDTMTYEEWSRIRLTEAKVLSYLKRILRKQNARPPRDEIRIVKRDYDFVYKGYSAKVRRQMSESMKTPVPLYLLASSDDIPQFPGYERLIRRKQKEYLCQNRQFSQMQEDADLAVWLSDLMLWDEENEEEIRLNDVQRHDINLVLQKRYGYLQWEQGGGKTLAGIAYGLYRMQKQNYHHTWVVSTAISIRNNWDEVLPNYGLSYVMIERLKDLERIKAGDFVLITLNKLSQYRQQIKKWIKKYNQKVALVFDESDEMSNPSSVRTKAVLDCFRRCKTKLLLTGTSTRNNISEFAPQMELLYNNSVNMLSWSPTVYHYEKDSEGGELVGKANAYFGQPIPAYKKGYSLFSASHLPEKITVFGVGQRTQDIYNADALNELLGKTVITRTFSEICGREIRRIHQVPLAFTAEEREVYQKAIDKFHEMRWNYFNSTGSYRKDAMMRLMQQITLLLRISAAPNTVEEYRGSIPTKIQKIIEMLGEWPDETVAIGVRHKVVLYAYEQAIRSAYPDRPLFVVTGTTMSFAQRRKLRRILKESGNGILLCTQQSLPSSVNFEYVNKVLIPELHYNNARMSQFYMRFIRYTSTEWKDIYFLTYGSSLESNLMQMVLAKEKINLFMKGQDADLDEIYERFGVDYDLLSQLMHREQDEKGHFHIRWGEQKIS